MEKKTFYVIFGCEENAFEKEENKFNNSEDALAFAIERLQGNEEEVGVNEDDKADVVKSFKDNFAQHGHTSDYYVNEQDYYCFIAICEGKDNAKDYRAELRDYRNEMIGD